MKKKIACVTGATGIVGKKIVEQLIERKYIVRVLCYKNKNINSKVDIFYGDLCDEEVLTEFISGACSLYHCAAELHDESKMWEVNVEGTKKLLKTIEKSDIKFFLFMSSAGVVGVSKNKIVNESTECNPVTRYEKTKWEAEKLVVSANLKCNTVIIRPTNIIEKNYIGILNTIISKKIYKKLICYLRSNEYAHTIHVDDVVSAALYFCNKEISKPEIYFVSNDNDPQNSIYGIKKICNKSIIDNYKLWEFILPPLIIPYLLRTIKSGKSNWGDIMYSSSKIKQAGFKFTFDTKSAVFDVLSP
ncbi:MAG: NAD(P)-dependent oxidoreductase [Desulfobacterales bacterium]|nr:NAD(P)-dependent oxidoreductase [Desulfobacterales bacterium]